MPLHQKARAISELCKLYEEGQEIRIDNEAYNPENSVIRCRRIEEIEELSSMEWTYDEVARTGNVFYTDGSKTEGRIGAGVIYFGDNKKEVYKERISGGDSYVAELRAIQMVLEIMKNKNIRKCDIFTDSRSALEALKSISYKGELVSQIKHTIKREEMDVYLHWVKAHIGIAGNEDADRAAKEASMLNNISVTYKYSRKEIKKKIQKKELAIWQNAWSNSSKGRWTHQIFKKVCEDRVCGDFILNQAITGHGSFAAYQNRFHNKDNLCLCGNIQTVEHCLFDCKCFEDIRTRLPRNFAQWDKLKIFSDYYCKKAIKDIVQALMDFHIPSAH